MKCFRAGKSEIFGQCTGENIYHNVMLKSGESFLNGLLMVASAPFHPALLTLRFGERRAVGGGPRLGISSGGETQVTLPPAAVYHVALGLLLLSVACLGLVHFVSCCSCRRCSGGVQSGSCITPRDPSCSRAAAAPGCAGGSSYLSACMRGLQLCPAIRRGWEACGDAGSWRWQRGTRSEVRSLMEGHPHALLPSLLTAWKPKRRCCAFQARTEQVPEMQLVLQLLLAASGVGGIRELL